MTENRFANSGVVVTPEAVNTFLGTDYPNAMLQAHISMASDMVEGYTRGEGFSAPCIPYGDVAQVIIAVAARSVANPMHIQREQAGTQSVTYGRFEGFTLAETRILNRYRQLAS